MASLCFARGDQKFFFPYFFRDAILGNHIFSGMHTFGQIIFLQRQLFSIFLPKWWLFSYNKRLVSTKHLNNIVSLYICAQMYTVNQGFGTCAAKGAHIGLRYPTMQIKLKPFFFYLYMISQNHNGFFNISYGRLMILSSFHS